MTTRLKILRELRHFQAEWPNSWLGARDISAFRRDPDRFAVAADELQADGLLLKTGGADSTEVGFRLNPERMAELRRELMPPMWRILLMIAFSLLAGAAAFMTFRAH
ncbi:MAG TPA: hypothetical protein VNX86_11035 [Rhizomicrobium sp.]|jgi:hypothetical protein|nr:hypothetical protein [Rhizomicrobium sp.]